MIGGLLSATAYVAVLLSPVAALHESGVASSGICVAPGRCTAPDTQYSLKIPGPSPGQQWNINGGFCGAWSTQQCALSVGAWISQDLVRKANRDQTGIAHNMHGNTTLGYEVMPSNVAYTANRLKLVSEEWDFRAPVPQAAAYKAWLKSHLIRSHPVIWFPLCKGDDHDCYEGACPGGGQTDHVEPVFGIYSNHPLDDATVYEDDWILHASDQDYEPYYRPITTLEDSLDMEGNCEEAGAGFGRNEMYPCFDEEVTYGLAVTGLAVIGSLPISLTVDTVAEPNVREFEVPSHLHGTVTINGLVKGHNYTLYRYNSTSNLPASPPFVATAQYSHEFMADGESWVYEDPKTFLSSSATYYLAAAAQH